MARHPSPTDGRRISRMVKKMVNGHRFIKIKPVIPAALCLLFQHAVTYTQAIRTTKIRHIQISALRMQMQQTDDPLWVIPCKRLPLCIPITRCISFRRTRCKMRLFLDTQRTVPLRQFSYGLSQFKHHRRNNRKFIYPHLYECFRK